MQTIKEQRDILSCGCPVDVALLDLYLWKTWSVHSCSGQAEDLHNQQINPCVTSGYPWSNPIRLNNFSYELSLIGIFLDGLPGTIVLPQDNLYLPLDHSWDGPFGGSQDG